MPKKKIVIIDADFGNLGSIINATKYLGFEFDVVKTASNLESYSHLILPGVGSYNRASKKLQSLGWFKAIKDFAGTSKPLLGICLGMQLMFEGGEEHGSVEGLNFFKGRCEEFPKDKKFPLPHMGFNFVKHNESKIWNNIPNPSPFYFIHSYRVKNVDNSATISKTFYGEEFISFIEKKNIFGAQFHPEKSHQVGLKLLKNFIDKN